MRALVCEAYGPIENLKIRDMPKPEPRAGEVLVKVGAAGVSFAVMLGVQGKHELKHVPPPTDGLSEAAKQNFVNKVKDDE